MFTDKTRLQVSVSAYVRTNRVTVPTDAVFKCYGKKFVVTHVSDQTVGQKDVYVSKSDKKKKKIKSSNQVVKTTIADATL